MQRVQQVLLNDATLEQLRGFATNYLGLELAPTLNTDNVRAKITAAWPQPFILVPDTNPPTSIESASSPPAPPTAPGEVPGAPLLAGRQTVRPDAGKVRISIARQEGPGGADPVPVGVNGKIMVIPRDEDCDIPYPYYEALSHAIKKVYDPMPDGNGYNPIPRLVPEYPWNTKSTPDEVDAARAHWAQIDGTQSRAA